MKCTERFFADRNYALSWAFMSVVIVAGILSLFLITKGVTEILQWTGNDGEYPSNVITVEGEGRVQSLPDVATFSFSVSATADTVDVAQTESATKINDIIAYLEEQGVEEVDIKATSYDAYPKYEWQRNCVGFDCVGGGKNVLIGYEINQSVSVKVRDTDTAGKILSGVGSRGATNISGLSFVIDDESGLKEEARVLAIKDAKEKAKRLAKELDVSLKDIVSFWEQNSNDGYGGDYMYAEQAYDMKVVNVAPELPMGENEIVSRVSITYEIR